MQVTDEMIEAACAASLEGYTPWGSRSWDIGKDREEYRIVIRAALTAALAEQSQQGAEEQVAFTLSDASRLLRKQDIQGVCPHPDDCFYESDRVRCGPCAVKASAAKGIEIDDTHSHLPEVCRLRREVEAATARITDLEETRAALSALVEEQPAAVTAEQTRQRMEEPFGYVYEHTVRYPSHGGRQREFRFLKKRQGISDDDRSEFEILETPVYASPVRSAIAPAPAGVVVVSKLVEALNAASEWIGILRCSTGNVVMDSFDDRDPRIVEERAKKLIDEALALSSPSLVHAEDGMAHGSATSTNGSGDQP